MNCPLKCDSLYERTEKENKVEITFKYVPFLYFILLNSIAVALLTLGKWTNVVFIFSLAVYIAYIAMTWKVMKEIHAAMKTSGIKVFGSKFSFANPLKVIIEKQ